MYIINSVVKRKKNSKAKRRGPAYPALQPDPTHLCFAYHRAMVAALALGPRGRAGEEGGGRVLIVGLGGGALPAYIHRHMPQVCGGLFLNKKCCSYGVRILAQKIVAATSRSP